MVDRAVKEWSLADVQGVTCVDCRNYAWMAPMRPVQGLGGELHHPSCPQVRQLDERQGMIRQGRFVRGFR